MKTIIRFALATGLALMMSLPTMAAPPQTINYQGYLTNPGGTAVNSAVVMTFKLYNVASGGSALWTETQTSVAVSNGNFNAVLGSQVPIPLPFDVPYWLTVTINADGEMSPRQPLAASPYAFRAASLDGVATITGAQITGTISAANLAVTQQLPAVACAANQIAKWNGSAWTCAADNVGGSVTSIVAGAGLSGGTITTSGTIAVDPASATLTGNFLKLGGNALGAPVVLGTTDAQPVVIKANGAQVMRYDATLASPNISGGYVANSAAGAGATVAGGGRAGSNCNDPVTGTSTRDCSNLAAGIFSTISGGLGNRSGGPVSTVSGGDSNDASGAYSAIGGGYSNRVSAFYSFVGGGDFNFASGASSTISGGGGNTTPRDYASIGGGSNNSATGDFSTVSGGTQNVAQGNYSAVSGGSFNVAQGVNSFAAGTRAKAFHDNAFVWSGSSASDSGSTAAGQFVVYAPGGVLLYAGALGAGGCFMYNGTSGWACSSDRALKTNIRAIDPVSILRRLVAMPVTSWSMKSRPDLTQIGPMAQDFFAAFGLGDTDKLINTTNAQGVALAAIQGLNQLLNEKDLEIKKQALRIEQQASRMQALEQMLAAIQTRVGIKSGH